MIAAVAGVVEAAARADPVDADDVRLVLDRPRLQQRRPVQPSLRRPVGRARGSVGVVRQLPELVGEAQVVADEQADPQPLDVDGDELGAGADVLLLAGVGERVDLAVAVHGAVGTGEHEHVGRALDRRPARPVGDLGARPADPHARARWPARRGTATTARPPARRCPACRTRSRSRTSRSAGPDRRHQRRPRRSSGRAGRSWRRGRARRCRAGSRRPATRSCEPPSTGAVGRFVDHLERLQHANRTRWRPCSGRA